MSDINSVALTGRFTRDPEVKVLPSGTEVAEMGIAVNYSKKDADGEWEDVASFFEVVMYGGRASVIGAKGRKGDTVTVLGRLQQDKWEAEDGSKREKVRVVAQNMSGELFYRKADGSDTPESEAVPAGVAPATGEGDDGIPF